MNVYQLGWHWQHPADFQIHRPNGHFGMQLILVQSKGRLTIGTDVYSVDKNTAFLVGSCVSHDIEAVGEPYCDDWIRFSPETADYRFFEDINLEWNVPIVLKDDVVSNLIAAAETVFQSNSTVKTETLQNIMRAILSYISGADRSVSSKSNFYDEMMICVRKEIYESPEKNWRIPEISADLNLSTSHFQRLYKAKYGISCSDDILNSRMQRAKELLADCSLTLQEVAQKCGFHSYEHFSRTFVRAACVSPLKYRKENCK